MYKKLNTINISSSGNLVSVIMDKNKKLLSVDIDDSLLDKSQKELLEEFIISTVNEAMEKVDEMNREDGEYDNDMKTDNISNSMFDMGKINKMAEDLSKLTSMGKDENGKPILNIPLGSINPTMIKNMLDMMKDGMNNDKDDKDKK